MAGTDEVFIGRQPILDRANELFAYELLFRSGRQRNEAQIRDNLSATASVISHAFAELGIEQALGPYKGFVNCDDTLLLSYIVELLPPQKIVLEILETVEVTPEIVERCRELKKCGFTLALDDFVNYEEKWTPLLDLVEIVKVDLMRSLDRIEPSSGDPPVARIDHRFHDRGARRLRFLRSGAGGAKTRLRCGGVRQ